MALHVSLCGTLIYQGGPSGTMTRALECLIGLHTNSPSLQVSPSVHRSHNNYNIMKRTITNTIKNHQDPIQDQRLPFSHTKLYQNVIRHPE